MVRKVKKKVAICVLTFLLFGIGCISVVGEDIDEYGCTLTNKEYKAAGEITSFDIDKSGKILVNIKALENEFSDDYYIQFYDKNFNYLNSIHYQTSQYATACFNSDGDIEILGYRTENTYVYNLNGDFLYKRKMKDGEEATTKSFRRLERMEGYYTRNAEKNTLLFTDIKGNTTVIIKLSSALSSSVFGYLFKEILTCGIVFIIVLIAWYKLKRKNARRNSQENNFAEH